MFFGEGLGTRKPPLGSVQFALTLDHNGLCGRRVALASSNLGIGDGDRRDGPLGLGAGLVTLRVEHVDLHLRQWLANLHEIAFVDHDILHPTGELGGDVDLRGLNAAIAADKAGTRT